MAGKVSLRAIPSKSFLKHEISQSLIILVMRPLFQPIRTLEILKLCDISWDLLKKYFHLKSNAVYNSSAKNYPCNPNYNIYLSYPICTKIQWLINIFMGSLHLYYVCEHQWLKFRPNQHNTNCFSYEYKATQSQTLVVSMA